ncbi:MAG: FG-GAP-like repeat-containing protein [Candidatus Sulfotelmatobacter sp.]|jgi:hypothetical protein
MKPTRLGCLLVLLASTMTLAQTNPVPFVNQPLVPMSAAPGGSGFTLTLNGTEFVAGSAVIWNGTALTTTFVSGSQLTAAVPASDIAVPGTATVTVSNPGPGGGTSNVMYFNVYSPTSTLTFASLYSVAYYGPLVAADFNGDGKIDLAWVGPVGTSGVSGICVQLGVGDGSFQTPVCAAGTFSTLNSMIAADFNRDGKIDLAGVDENGLHVLLGNGDGTLQAEMDFTGGPSGSQSLALAAADFNGDGKLDLAVANAPNGIASSGCVSILRGNGDGTFQSHVDYALGTPGLYSVAVGEFNGDGYLDLVSNSVILLGNGDGTFGSPQPLPSTAGEQIMTADVNGDGKLDLIELSPESESEAVSVLLGNGDGTFQPAINYAAPNYFPFAGAVANFNNGKVDLAVVNNQNPGSAFIFLGNGDGTFQSPVDFASGPNPAALAVADFNGDGRTDLAVMAQDSQFNANLTVLLQGTWPALQSGPPYLTFAQQAIGTTSPPQDVTLTNSGTATLGLSKITITGANAGDFAQNNNCPATLGVNANCQIIVTFTPTALGNRTAAVSISDNAPGNPQTVPLTGTTPAYLSPATVTFPSQYVGTSGLPQSVQLNNTGNTALALTSVTASPGDFEPLSTCGNSVGPGSSCSIGVFFDPTTTGIRNGTLTVMDSASDSPQTASLTGVGQDFSLAPSGSSMATVSPGQTANYTVSVAPGGGFDQTVLLSCGGAPAQSTCSLPTSLALNGSAPTTVSVTVTTAGSSAGLTQSRSGPGIVGTFGVWVTLSGTLGLAILASLGSWRRARCSQWTYGLTLLCLLIIGVTLSACGGSNGGGGGGSGTQAGTYNLTVTGTFTSGSTTLTHSTKLTLMVQ